MAEREVEHVPAAVVVDVEGALVSYMEQKIRTLGTEPEEEDMCTIYRVPSVAQEEDYGTAYEPRIISIGPFHRGKQALQSMERLKWRYLYDLINRNPANTLDKYVDKVRASERRARKCYSEEIKLEPDEFVEMMVLDGCFIIEFLVKWNLVDKEGQLSAAANWNLPLLRNDLLLLENQIPFFILQYLFDLSFIPNLDATVKEDGSPITLKDLALNYVTSGKMDGLSCPNPVHHLLHLFHSTLRRPATDLSKGSEPYSCGWPVTTIVLVIDKIKHLVSYSFLWLLSAFLYCRRPPSEEGLRAPRMIPTAMELREAGVKFKKKKVATSFLDVSFRNGNMEIPRLSLQEATVSQFRNLVAFEQCCPTSGSDFTCYAALLSYLIDTPQDVALLEGCGILENKLGGDRVVAKFFNNLRKGGFLNYENHYLVGLFREVMVYCQADRHNWRARLMHDYFSSPWSIISLIAAIVLLILTMMQTFFTVLAYFRPPSQSSPPPS